MSRKVLHKTISLPESPNTRVDAADFDQELNYNGSQNNNKEPVPVDDNEIVYCACGERNMFTESVVIAAVVVFFLYIIAAVVSHCIIWKGRNKLKNWNLKKNSILEKSYEMDCLWKKLMQSTIFSWKQHKKWLMKYNNLTKGRKWLL